MVLHKMVRNFHHILDFDYDVIMAQFRTHLEGLKTIVQQTGVVPEGDCYHTHMSFNEESLKVADRKNIISLAMKSNTIIDIGFNMGCSTLLMLLSNPNCCVYCYDVCQHPYTDKCMEYISLRFKDRVFIVKGNTSDTLKNYTGPIPDLIHIDGSKNAQIQDADFYVSLKLSKPSHTVLLFNDCWLSHVNQSFIYFEQSNILKRVRVHDSCQLIGLVEKQPKLPIALCTLSIGDQYKSIVKYSNKIKMDYCKRYLYDYRDDEDEGIVDKSRPLAWSKVNLISRCLEEGYEYVVWMDADAYIMNPDVRLENIIVNFSKDKDMLMCIDTVDTLNSGVLFIKNTEWSKAFFKHLYTMTDFINHSNWEQGALIDMYKNNTMDTKNHILVLPKTQQRLFNSYYGMYKQGDFIVHLAGCWRDDTDRGLRHMMNIFCPIRMEDDSDETYQKRMEMLSAK
jgi:hypothetical protein